jgi:hypothetical protein
MPNIPVSSAPLERMIAHADMDAFYATVEQLDNPELRDRPVIVAASSMRGVVSSASYEARKFGIRAAMPSLQARQLCPHGVFVRGRMGRYVEIWRLVRKTFDAFSPLVEPLPQSVISSLTLLRLQYPTQRKMRLSGRASNHRLCKKERVRGWSFQQSPLRQHEAGALYNFSKSDCCERPYKMRSAPTSRRVSFAPCSAHITFASRKSFAIKWLSGTLPKRRIQSFTR